MSITNATQFIHVETGGVYYLHQIRKRENKVSLPKTPTVEQMSALGYEVVQPVERPEGDVVTAGDVVQEDGIYKQSWIARDFTPEEYTERLNSAKAQKLDEIRHYRLARLNAGVPYTFPSGNLRHVQVRDGDRTNINSLFLESMQAISAGNEEYRAHFLTLENELEVMTASEFMDMANHVAPLVKVVLEDVWAKKAMVRAAITIAQVEDVVLE